jgi:hypothetical protein
MSGGSLAVLLCVDQAASAAVAEQWERAIAEAWLHKPYGQRQNDAAATVAHPGEEEEEVDEQEAALLTMLRATMWSRAPAGLEGWLLQKHLARPKRWVGVVDGIEPHDAPAPFSCDMRRSVATHV